MDWKLEKKVSYMTQIIKKYIFRSNTPGSTYNVITNDISKLSFIKFVQFVNQTGKAFLGKIK